MIVGMRSINKFYKIVKVILAKTQYIYFDRKTPSMVWNVICTTNIKVPLFYVTTIAKKPLIS